MTANDTDMIQRQEATAPDDRNERVGFIGIGNLGAPIARRIGEAGWPLTVWDLRAEAAAAFADIAEIGSDVESVASRSDILCLAVLDDKGVTEVVGRALKVMEPGGLITIISTVSPDCCARLGALATEHGIGLIDTPVSGGPAGAQKGELTVMMGGEQALCDRASRMFTSFARLMVRLGDIGSGQRAKLVNNALTSAILGVTQDARELGHAFGIDSAALDELIGASSGGSFAHGILRGLPSLEAFRRASHVMRKDVQLTRDLCVVEGVEAPSTLFGAADDFLARYKD